MADQVRIAALNSLQNIISKGTFINLELQRVLSQEDNWSTQERGQYTELLYGTVRWQLYLDHFLARWSSQKLDRLEIPVLASLRLGLYQIRFRDGTPAHAAVDATCEALKLILPRAVGYVNAVLRKAAVETEWQVKAHDKDLLMAITYSHPLWLVKRWVRRWGEENTLEMLQSNNRAPMLWIRCNSLKVHPDELGSLLDSKQISYKRHEGIPEAFGLIDEPLSSLRHEFDNGLISIQDLGAMYMAHALKPQSHETILDLCAAPGGKSTHMAELMQDQGKIVSLELHQTRMELISRQAKRLDLTSISAFQHDARMPWPNDEPQQFDKVLLDAPCSGTGVVRRKVDSRWSKDESQLIELQKLQRELLATAAVSVKDGGQLLYATCSLEAEENEANLRWFLKEYPHFKLEPFVSISALKELPGADQGYATLLPTSGEKDGFFLALMRNTRNI